MKLILTVNKNISSVLTKNCNSKGENIIKASYSGNMISDTVKCFGWFDGDAGFENKHELPPNGHSNDLEE